LCFCHSVAGDHFVLFSAPRRPLLFVHLSFFVGYFSPVFSSWKPIRTLLPFLLHTLIPFCFGILFHTLSLRRARVYFTPPLLCFQIAEFKRLSSVENQRPAQNFRSPCLNLSRRFPSCPYDSPFLPDVYLFSSLFVVDFVLSMFKF